MSELLASLGIRVVVVPGLPDTEAALMRLEQRPVRPGPELEAPVVLDGVRLVNVAPLTATPPPHRLRAPQPQE